METLFIYLIKSSGLIALFYFSYYLLLRKETFFTSNRSFLLTGLITAAVLPLIVFTKIIWIEPTPTNFDLASIPMKATIKKADFQDNLPLIFALVYGIGMLALLAKLVIDLYSLNSVLKGKTIQRQADFKFIDVSENLAPFSYFSYIVYNSSLFNQTELENILEHEKVHSEQNHTLDVLISRLFCVVFWFNPFIWLYKKAIEQNLEFIADSEASKKISDKKAYQFTLLKITTQENCVAITNHFYQSLIKKRIVMLNKNQSNKRNSWKYALILPLLAFFMLAFQIKEVIQEKESTTKGATNEADLIKIDKNFTDQQLENKAEFCKKEFNCDLVFSEIERNSKNEITGITVNYNRNSSENGTYKQYGNQPIASFFIKQESGKITVNDVDLVNQRNKNKSKTASLTEKEIFIKGVKTPTPPVFPTGSMPQPPTPDMSKMPTPPIPPSNGNDAIAMGNYEKDMAEYEKKLESFEPDMTAYEATVEKEMQKREQIYEKAMSEYEKKMEALEPKFDDRQSKSDIEQAKKDAQQAKKDSQQAKRDAEQAKRDAQQAKRDAEQAKKDAELDKRDAEIAKRNAEQAKTFHSK